MRRADRLFEIIQVLRRASAPMTAEAIAEALETSKWTIYRDIAALVARRVPIHGEAGVGYVLERDFHLPPLMLTAEEVESVLLGLQWVTANADPVLARAALDAMAKIASSVPQRLRETLDDPTVGTPPARGRPASGVDVSRLRAWVRAGRKLAIRYVDENGRSSDRVVWPFLIGYAGTLRTLMAWCELREDVRMFRIDRLAAVDFLEQPYPARRAALRERWLASIEPRNGEAIRTRSPRDDGTTL